MSKDRRSETSRANLGNHIPEALSQEGSTSIGIRLPNELIAKIDTERGNEPRSVFIRRLIADALD